MIGLGYLFALLYVFFVIGIGFFLYRLGVPKVYTRKFIHIFVSFEWVILYHFMGTTVHFFFVCLFFLSLLTLVYLKRWMPMMTSDGENDPGTVYYAVAMSMLSLLTLFLPELVLPFGVGVFATSFGDGLAGVVGQAVKRRNPEIYRGKTLVGSLACFLLTTFSSFLLFIVYGMPLHVGHAAAIGLFAAGVELLTSHGLDNITVTLSSAALAFFFLKVPSAGNYIFPILLTPFILVIVFRSRALRADGVIAALLLDAAVSVFLGNFGFLTLLFFFALSLLADAYKKEKKKKLLMAREAKGTRRDAYQVLANGLLPIAAAGFYFGTGKSVFLIAFTTGLAEALADTVASAIGVLSPSAFDLFRFRRCERGISGGMSWRGTLASFVGAYALSFFSCLFGMRPLFALLAGTAAFFGGIFDSLLGSLLQVKYRCRVCRRLTEKSVCCAERTERVGGLPFLDNDLVNLFSSLFAILLSIGGYFLFFQ